MFEGDDLNAKGISGKENKIEFLKKIILCTGIANGKVVDVNPNKVVAGKEVSGDSIPQHIASHDDVTVMLIGWLNPIQFN